MPEGPALPEPEVSVPEGPALPEQEVNALEGPALPQQEVSTPGVCRPSTTVALQDVMPPSPASSSLARRPSAKLPVPCPAWPAPPRLARPAPPRPAWPARHAASAGNTATHQNCYVATTGPLTGHVKGRLSIAAHRVGH